MATPSERYAAARQRVADSRTRFAHFAAGLPFELDDFQVRACRALEDGRNVLVAAPTGAGKTVVAEFAVHLALAAGRKAFYTAPIKALSNQKYHDLVQVHGPEQIGLLTGDTSINSEAPVVVMTTEVLRNMLYSGSATLDGLGYVVMDEVHYLADRFRGPVWEEVILHLSATVTLVALSATVSNAEELGDWLTEVRGHTEVVVSEVRPVPLWQHVLTHSGLYDLYAEHVDPTDPGPHPPINSDLLVSLRRAPSRTHARGRSGRSGQSRGRRAGASDSGPPRRLPRPAVVETLERHALLPAIFFIFSRAGCDAAVTHCLRSGLKLTTPGERAEIETVLAEAMASLPPEDLSVLGYWDWHRSLVNGIAAHHAGQLPAFKEAVEELFTRGLVKVVFATETLALGLNMPARSVVLDTLTKWDGTAHADLTAGEYTQITGRAGRRGIDIEGHAVVVEHGHLDPIALAGLASRRTYRLRSAFRPTYNMAVNLVAQFGRERAQAILEQSFAQFQADRAVVGLAKQAHAHTEALAGYAEAMSCHLGDFAEYAALRRELSTRERDLARERGRAKSRAIVADLASVRRGDVLEVPGTRRALHSVVLEASGGLEGPSVRVLTSEGKVRSLRVEDLSRGFRVVAHITIAKSVEPRNARHRNDLAASLRNALSDPTKRVEQSTGERSRTGDDATVTQLRRALRAHPCHGCSQREDHARWAERHYRLAQERDALVRRIENRTSSVARVFVRVTELLAETGYLVDVDGRLEVTGIGQTLRGMYAENDLLVVECLRRGAWTGLDAAGLAAVISGVVYDARREETTELTRGADSRLRRSVDATLEVWSQLAEIEGRYDLDATRRLDLGLVEPMHRWARGRSLTEVLAGTSLAAGDFVRWAKQTIDLLDQVAATDWDPRLVRTAREAMSRVRRGVVEHSGA